MASAVGLAIANARKPLQRFSPASVRVLEIENWLAGRFEEQIVVIDLPTRMSESQRANCRHTTFSAREHS
jgi:hypothetical protein